MTTTEKDAQLFAKLIQESPNGVSANDLSEYLAAEFDKIRQIQYKIRQIDSRTIAVQNEYQKKLMDIDAELRLIQSTCRHLSCSGSDSFPICDHCNKKMEKAR